MRKRHRLLAVTVMLLVISPMIHSTDRTDRKESAGEVAKSRQSARIVVRPVVAPIVQQKSTQTAGGPVTARPAAGEQIKWRVMSGGGGRGVSTNYILSGTMGQTAVGQGTSPSNKLTHGFWQPTPPSCCIGATGNADGSPGDIVDISDIFAIVSFLVDGAPMSACFAENDVNRDGTVDISDIFMLIDFLVDSVPLPACP